MDLEHIAFQELISLTLNVLHALLEREEQSDLSYAATFILQKRDKILEGISKVFV